jgi:hypothetical protein
MLCSCIFTYYFETMRSANFPLVSKAMKNKKNSEGRACFKFQELKYNKRREKITWKVEFWLKSVLYFSFILVHFLCEGRACFKFQELKYNKSFFYPSSFFFVNLHFQIYNIYFFLFIKTFKFLKNGRF